MTGEKHGFKPVQCDNQLLSKQGYGLQSVPDDGVHISLQNACNMALGGETERRPLSSLHPAYKLIAKRLYQKTLLRLIGLDLMTTDPSAKPTSKNAFINEFNSKPSTDVPYFADVYEGRELFGAKRILQAVAKDLTLR